MRKTSMLMLAAAAVVSFPALAAAPSTFKMQANGSGVASVIHYEAEDGTVTEGYLFGANVRHGSLPDVPYDKAIVFFGTRCFWTTLGYCVTFSGAAPASYKASGLSSAQLAGTVEALPFYDGSNLPPDPLPPIVIDVNLTYTGTGTISSSGGAFASGSAGSVYVSYSFVRFRYANVSGSATVDGNAALVDTAQLLGETAGEFNLVAMPGR